MKNLIEINKKSKLLETELIGRIFWNLEQGAIAMRLIKPEEFYYYRKEFETLIDCVKNDKQPLNEFTSNNLSLVPFVDTISFSRNIESICIQLREISNARKLSIILQDLDSIPTENTLDFISELNKKIFSQIEKLKIERGDIDSVFEELEEKQKYYQEKFKNNDGIIGISTGYSKLDNVIDGLRPSHLWVIGAYTNMGKTTAALNIISSVIKQKKRVAFYSLEMSRLDVLTRLLGIMTEQNSLKILKGYDFNIEKINEAKEEIKESGLVIHSIGAELSELIFSMQEEVVINNVEAFVIDFIQLVSIKGVRTEYETISQTILELQQVAKRLDVPIIILSQISNEGAKTESPIMTFKGSGSIAAAADIAIEIKTGEDDMKTMREKMNEGEDVLMKWDIRKNRHGKVGTIDLSFNGKTGLFKELNKKEVGDLQIKF